MENGVQDHKCDSYRHLWWMWSRMRHYVNDVTPVVGKVGRITRHTSLAGLNKKLTED